MKTKRCTTCGKRRLLKYFCKYVHAPDGLAYKCNPCQTEYVAKNKVSLWLTASVRRYGTTREFILGLFKGQAGRCAICGKEMKMASRTCHIDHCHETGVIRGLLCGQCNVGLGMFQNSAILLRKAAEYVEKSL